MQCLICASPVHSSGLVFPTVFGMTRHRDQGCFNFVSLESTWAWHKITPQIILVSLPQSCSRPPVYTDSFICFMRRGRRSPQGRRRQASGREDAHCAPSLQICPVCSPPPLRAPQGRCVRLYRLCGPAEVPSTWGFAQRALPPSPHQEPLEHLCPRH